MSEGPLRCGVCGSETQDKRPVRNTLREIACCSWHKGEFGLVEHVTTTPSGRREVDHDVEWIPALGRLPHDDIGRTMIGFGGIGPDFAPEPPGSD
jgi:hypothetical protein